MDMEVNMEEPGAMRHVYQARNLASSGNNVQAFDLYCKILSEHADMQDSLEHEFRALLTQLNKYLAASEKLGDIFSNFERAVEVYPRNVYLLNDIGLYLFNYGYSSEACCHFQKALKLEPGYVAAEKNLNSVKNFLVERWHFRMLNDIVRNDAYRKAIHETVTRLKDSVLDLGTGTGILAMYTTECQAVAVTACDASETMAQIAANVFFENNVLPVVVVNKMSTELDYKDIGGRRSVVITELFDAGLFGEHVLETILHAKSHLMSKVSRILPLRAEYFVAGVNCEALNNKYQLSQQAKELLGIQDKLVHISSEDSYDCDDIHLYKNITYLTQPASLLKIDFNDMDDVKQKLESPDLYKTNLKVRETGEINAVIGWFHLELSKTVTITTNPTSALRANAWQQAVFFDYAPKMVTDNDSIPIEFTCVKSKLAMKLSYSDEIIRISNEMLRFLNDYVYMQKITSSIGTLCIYLGQITEMSQITMVDLQPFPIFGFLMMKRGAQSLICYAKNIIDKEFIIRVFETHKIDMGNVTILVGDALEHSAFRNQKYHIIFYNILDLCGDVNTRMKDIIDHLRRGHLLEYGLLLPFKVNLMGQLIDSKWLDINNRIYDENAHGYKIAMFINKYQVSQNVHLNLENLVYTEISKPILIGEVSQTIPPLVIDIDVERDGEVNAVLCWYSIEMMEHASPISTKHASSYVDGMAFLADPKIPVLAGTKAHILRCIDSDGCFKLVIDNE